MQFFSDRFKQIVSEHPGKPALVFDNSSVTYSQLDSLSNKVASKLIRLGACKEKIYPIYLERSIDYIVAELGVLKSGAAFAPLSIGYPSDRVDFIKKDCGCDFLIDKSFMADIASESEEFEKPNLSFEDMAFVVYTSGSTGNPKGIVHDHFSYTRAIMRNCAFCAKSDDVNLSVAPFYFVSSVADIMQSLWVGATICILTEEQRKDMLFIEQYIAEHNVTISVFSPQLLRQFPNKKTGLKKIVCGGERISGVFLDYTEVDNIYGLSETAGVVTVFPIDKEYDNTPIGKAADDFTVYLLDENGTPVADGEEGEICVAGPIARGYLNLPEQSAKTFVENPFSTGELDKRMLRTGDIGKRLADGNIVYVNRKDWMIKINGQRVEMGEVEQQIGKVSGVSGAVVKGFVDANGQNFLCAYYTSDTDVSQNDIKATIEQKLPSYMIPRFIVKLQSFPLNANGKLDRKSLEAPSAEDFKSEYVAPSNDDEASVCRAFEKVLSVEKVGVNDDFFAMGGDSIKAIMLQEELIEMQLSVSDIFAAKTPKQIAELKAEVLDKVGYEHREMDAYPMTDSQLGVYLVCVKEPDTLMYNSPACLYFDNSTGVEPEKLRENLIELIDRYPFLKATVKVVDGVPCMIKNPQMKYEVEIVETQLTDKKKIFDEFITPFDMENGPLFKFSFYKNSYGFYLYTDVHHIISDGTSFSAFFAKLSKLYMGEDIRAEYVDGFDVCAHDALYKQTEEYKKNKEYFENYLGGVEVDSNLTPDDDISLAAKKGENAVITVNLRDYIPQSLIEQKAVGAGVTENSIFLSAFSYALAKQSGQNESLFCVAESGRHTPLLKDTFGMMVYSVPIYIQTDETSEIDDYMQTVQSNLMNSIKNDAYSIVNMSSDLGVNTDILYVYQGEMLSGITVNNSFVPLEIFDHTEPVANLSLDIFKTKGDYVLNFEYRPELYLESSMQNFVQLVVKILRGIVDCKTLADITLVSDSDIKFYEKANDNDFDFDRSKTIVDLFRDMVAEYPDNRAVVFGDKELTYSELDRCSENLAQALTKLGVTYEVPVGVMVKRCEIYPVCALGVLKAGGAVQPLDSNYPEERLQYMVEDSKAEVVIVDRELESKIPNYKGKRIYADEIYSLLPDSSVTLTSPKPESLFTLIYTSGSTGNPKGVMIEQRNVVSLCKMHQHMYNMTTADVGAAYSSFGFDASLVDFYPYLTLGATVCIVPEEIRLDLVALNEFFENQKITMVSCTTQLARQYASTFSTSGSLRHVYCGGEKLVPFTPPEYTFSNLYGPTECTTYITRFDLDRDYRNVPIGRSTSNSDVYIVDKFGRLLPPGVPGELCVSGYQVSRGYLNRPELSEKIFAQNPFSDKSGYEKMYHTGDVCRYLANGQLDFVGRKDGQVKIRGFRIELTEIERRIREFDGIKNAVVIAKDLPAGGKAVVGYIVSDSQIDIQKLNAFVADKLPKYMVPSITMQIDDIPVNVNGKVDKRKLPEPSLQRSDKPSSAPRALNVIEQKLKSMASEICGIDSFELDDNLVTIGFTSLSTIAFSTKLYETFGVRFSVSDLLDDDCTLITVENLIIESLMNSDSKSSDDSSDQSRTVESALALCTPQQGVYFDTMKHPDSIAYNIPSLLSFGKNVDVQRLKSAVEAVVGATPVMTSKIETQSGRIVQTQIDGADIDVPITEITEAELQLLCDEFVKPFDLHTGPLFRITIAKTESRVAMLFDVHHIVFDGLSVGVFLNNVKSVYESGTTAKTDTSYYDFVNEDIDYQNSEKLADGRAYFEKMFADYESASGITPDLHGKPEDGLLKESVSLLDSDRVESFCRQNSITPASLFLAGTIYTVARFCADDKVYMTMISSGRDDIRFVNSIGMFVRSVPVHGKLSSDTSVAEFIKQTAVMMNTSIKNGSYPISELSQKYGFASKINYACQLGVEPTITFDGKAVEFSAIVMPAPKFDISVHIENVGNDIGVNIQYNDALYSKKYMDTLSSALSACVNNMIDNPDSEIEKLSLLSENDKAILNKFKSEPFEENEINVFHKMFEAQVIKHPDKTVLTAVDNSFTYAELDAESNRIANALIEGGVQKGDRVALLLPRTSRFIISLLGVLKAGCAYIPCDPEYPQDRIEYIIENSEARYLITTADKTEQFASNAVDVETLLMNQNTDSPNVEVEPCDLAYIIYTSGSTGKPKGVMVMHQGISNYLAPHKDNIHIYALSNEATKILSVTTVSFDMSLKEYGTALCNGLELVFASEEEAQNPALLVELFDKTQADAFNATPSRLEQYMMMPSFCKALSRCKVIMCGGEKYSEKLLQKLQSTTKAKIFNTYGPTEISVSCNASELTASDCVNVGRPLHNVTEYIVDKNDNLLPPSIIGELYVGGYGVTKGYVANKAMTDKSFVDFNGERVYKTGDYARWDSDGNVVILGRTDNQVKLRGLRIELGEIERSILADSRINQAVVVIKEINSTEHLCAYFCATEMIDENELKARISKNLTAYMVPSVYVQLDKMPQTPNGKTDVKRLPAPTGVQPSVAEYVAPQSAEEQKLCDIFAEVLSLDKVGANDSFFDLGGTSLTVTSLLVKMSDAGFEISYGDVFAHKTPQGLASLVRGGESDAERTVKDYDYAPIDEILKRNSLVSYANGENNKIGNLLLTGVVGFLGIHILHDFIENYDGKVYCLARGNNLLGAKERLQSSLFYYFENGYEDLFDNRIFVVEGDVRSKEWFAQLENDEINTVINCAALVKHFSETNDIEEINVGGVQNLIEFCRQHDSMIVQVSTGSIAGARVNGYPDKDLKFNEQMLYVGQMVDNNKYIYSKFIGERCVLEAKKQGLRAKIMRVGNLAARDTDGEFQINFTTNGFMGRLRGYLAIGGFPYSAMNRQVEMAPINATASAILLLCQTPDDCCVFHPFNNHYVPIGDIILQMRRMGFAIKLVEDNEFGEMLHKAQEDPEKSKLLTTMLAYNSADNTKMLEPISTDNEYTTQLLYRKGFEWSMTSREYMNRFLEAIDGLGFFNLELAEEEKNV